jgi:hypothetical protein
LSCSTTGAVSDRLINAEKASWAVICM